MRRALPTVFVLAALWACDDPEPKVEALREDPEPAAEPEPALQPLAESERETPDEMKSTLLGLGEPDAGAAPEPQAEVRAEPDPPPRRRRREREQKQKPRTQPEMPGLRPDSSRGGGLSDAAFNGALTDWRGVQSCIATEVQRGAGTQTGALRVAFKIQPDGSVLDAKVVETSSPFARSLSPCVERKAKRVEFPSFAGDEPAKKTAKFVF